MYFTYAAQLVIVLIAINFITPNNAIKCFVCMGKEECQNATLFECNSSLLTVTNNYIKRIHRAEPKETETQDMECLHETLNYPYGRIDYMGCNNAANRVCSMLHTDVSMPDYACEVTNGDDNVLLNTNKYTALTSEVN